MPKLRRPNWSRRTTPPEPPRFPPFPKGTESTPAAIRAAVNNKPWPDKDEKK